MTHVLKWYNCSAVLYHIDTVRVVFDSRVCDGRLGKMRVKDTLLRVGIVLL